MKHKFTGQNIEQSFVQLESTWSGDARFNHEPPPLHLCPPTSKPPFEIPQNAHDVVYKRPLKFTWSSTNYEISIEGWRGGCRFWFNQTRRRIFQVDTVMLEEMLSNGNNVDSDMRTKSTYLFVGVVWRLSDVLVLKVSIHRYVTLKSEISKNSFFFMFCLKQSPFLIGT